MGASALPLLVSIHLRPTGLRPVRPCFRFGCISLHLPVPQILYFLSAGSFGLAWVQRPPPLSSPLDIVFCFPLDVKVYVLVNCKDVQVRQRRTKIFDGPSISVCFGS